MSQLKEEHQLYVDKLDGFYKSDLWQLIKARLIFMQSRLEHDAIIKLQTGDSSSQATKIAARADGVKLAIEITEGLASDIDKGSFDADDAWVVIENILSKNGTKGIKTSWIRPILAKFKKTKQ